MRGYFLVGHGPGRSVQPIRVRHDGSGDEGDQRHEDVHGDPIALVDDLVGLIDCHFMILFFQGFFLLVLLKLESGRKSDVSAYPKRKGGVYIIYVSVRCLKTVSV